MQVIQHRDVPRYFVDTEFYEDGSTIDLISLGCVASDGRQFYAVNSDANLVRVSDWVKTNVVAELPPKGAWKQRAQIAREFAEFVRPAEGLEIWGYYSDYDWVVIAQLYGTMMELPKHFPKYCLDLKQLSVLLGSPRHPEQKERRHNALADAKWNRELYEFLRGWQCAEKARAEKKPGWPLLCSKCGSVRITTSYVDQQFVHEFELGQSTVLAAKGIPLRRCGACNVEYTDHVAIEIRLAAVAEHRRKLQGGP